MAIVSLDVNFIDTGLVSYHVMDHCCPWVAPIKLLTYAMLQTSGPNSSPMQDGTSYHVLAESKLTEQNSNHKLLSKPFIFED